jgi:hypothetical protein
VLRTLIPRFLSRQVESRFERDVGVGPLGSAAFVAWEINSSGALYNTNIELEIMDPLEHEYIKKHMMLRRTFPAIHPRRGGRPGWPPSTDVIKGPTMSWKTAPDVQLSSKCL